jgi:hypothetical protein
MKDKILNTEETANSDLGAFTIDDLRKAFEAGRTVSNYKGEWQETYNDNYTSAKYDKFEDWLKNYA